MYLNFTYFALVIFAVIKTDQKTKIFIINNRSAPLNVNHKNSWS